MKQTPHQPNRPSAHSPSPALVELFQQGQQALQTHQFAKAEQCFLDAQKMAPQLLEIQNALAMTYAASQQHEKALPYFKALLQAHPQDAHTRHNIANCLFQLGQFDKAITNYRMAYKLNPSLVDSYLHCGMAHLQLKQYQDAIAHIHEALNRDPRNARAFHALGKTHMALKEESKALDYLQNASKLEPANLEFKLVFAKYLDECGLVAEASVEYHTTCLQHPHSLEAFSLYGKFLLSTDCVDEALECVNRLVELAPEEMQAIAQQATVYLAMGNTKEALKGFELALQKSPDNLDILNDIGVTYLEAGQLDDAIIIANKMITLAADTPKGYLLKARVKKSVVGDGQTESLIRLSQLKHIPREEKMLVHYALGKAYDDQKNYAEAMNYYAMANNIRKQNKAFNYKEELERFQAIIDFFTPTFMQSHQHFATDITSPIFIVGMPRSGTTLTEQIISSHPDITGAGEVKFWGKAPGAIPLRIGSSQKYPDCLNELTKETAHSVAELYETTLHNIIGKDHSPKFITDKMPHNFMFIPLLALLYPTAKFIHTKRDPVDTCLSIYFQNFNDAHIYAADLAHVAYHYRLYENMMQHWHALLPGRILDVNYEDTISDPEYWSREMIAHLGLPWSDACLAPQKQERAVKTPSQWQVRQPIYKTSVQRWKHYEPFIKPLLDGLAETKL